MLTRRLFMSMAAGGLCAVVLLPSIAADANLETAQTKLDAIQSGRIKPGYGVTFSEAEVNAWAGDRAQKFDGVRESHVQFGTGTVTASALIDFLQIRKAEGLDTNGAIAKLIEGERPVRVELRISSNAGRATVTPLRVEISGVGIPASVLDFLVMRFVVPIFPQANVGQPFELKDGIERVEIRPGALRVIMKK